MFTELVGNWALDPLLLVIAVSIIYLILGMFLDPLGMILLTIPVFVPMFAALEPRSGLVRRAGGEIYRHRPADAAGRLQHLRRGRRAPTTRSRCTTIFRGCYWFLACEVVIMTLLIAFPQISLWLPSADELTAGSGQPHGWVALSCREGGSWLVNFSGYAISELMLPPADTILTAQRTLPVWSEPQKASNDQSQYQSRLPAGACVRVLSTRVGPGRLWAEIAPAPCS